MKRQLVVGVVVALAAALCASALVRIAHAIPLGSFFTYQGQLTDAGETANGGYDMRFTVYDAAVNGTQIGRVDEHDGLPVRDGLFTVTLNFGPDVFTGEQRWLEIAVRPDSGNEGAPYTALSPRQNLTAAPYSLYALSAGSVPWDAVADVPPGFRDGQDNDTTYVAGTGLTLTNQNFAVAFAGTGQLFTVARSDHNHTSAYVAKTGDTMTGDLTSTRVKAGAPASSACVGAGDVCAANTVVADHNVVAVLDVFAGRDVEAAGMLRTGAPDSAACSGSGHICATRDVVADEAVRAGVDVIALGRVRAETATNTSCNGPGDVCAGDDAVADHQVVAGTVNNPNCNGTGDICAGADLSADANVYQGRAANGLVKAGVTAHCTHADAIPTIIRSFNNVNGAAITISGGDGFGECTIDFGFQVDDRYIIATPISTQAVAVTVTEVSGTSASFFRWRQATGDGSSGQLHILVY